jgi:hypothetical protein
MVASRGTNQWAGRPGEAAISMAQEARRALSKILEMRRDADILVEYPGGIVVKITSKAVLGTSKSGP